tara:strand:- start:545 stop:745 length:201 start_codon:yes stop_codon:yes gene_type:complete
MKDFSPVFSDTVGLVIEVGYDICYAPISNVRSDGCAFQLTDRIEKNYEEFSKAFETWRCGRVVEGD